jgi:hypothetical protein
MLALFNQMHLNGRIKAQQKHGIVMCLRKTDNPTTPADYRPITVLNMDYKILAPIIANRPCGRHGHHCHVHADDTATIATSRKSTLLVSYLESYLSDCQRWLSEW